MSGNRKRGGVDLGCGSFLWLRKFLQETFIKLNSFSHFSNQNHRQTCEKFTEEISSAKKMFVAESSSWRIREVFGLDEKSKVATRTVFGVDQDAK